VRRILTTSEAVRPPRYERGRWNAASIESSLDELEPGVFSDEYDLCEYVDARAFSLNSDIRLPLFSAHEGEIFLHDLNTCADLFPQTQKYWRTSNAL